jgi:hypothetical protein
VLYGYSAYQQSTPRQAAAPLPTTQADQPMTLERGVAYIVSIAGLLLGQANQPAPPPTTQGTLPEGYERGWSYIGKQGTWPEGFGPERK